MKIPFSKYHGTGNDFILVDNRKLIFNDSDFSLIKKLCDRRFGIGADGLMLLNVTPQAGISDFEMVYYNADGNIGSMCGNGGRCMAAFARRLGLIKDETAFHAADGMHHARVEQYDDKNFSANVFLKMNDVSGIEEKNNALIVDTGSPHYVTFVDDPQKINVVEEGRKLRYSSPFSKEGINVNFISLMNDIIHIRTYERGVEDETLSCGTGAVASVLAAARKGLLNGKTNCRLKTQGGELNVHFEKVLKGFENIFLEGPATFVFDGDIDAGF